MKKVLIDSSVWISLFIKDNHTQFAEEIYKNIVKKNYDIILPNIVYCEVINNIIKLGKENRHKLLNEVKSTFNAKNINMIYGNKIFWDNKVGELCFRVSLKTMDAIILSFAMENRCENLFSFDRKLKGAYLKHSHYHLQYDKKEEYEKDIRRRKNTKRPR